MLTAPSPPTPSPQPQYMGKASLLLSESWVLVWVWVVSNATLCLLGMGTSDLASGYQCMHVALVPRMPQGSVYVIS